MCPAGVCRSLLSASTRISTTVLATDSAMPKTSPADQPQPKACASSAPSTVATALCTTAPGTATRAHGQQLLEVELQPDAEHQQDDADLGELLGQRRVGDEAGRVRPDQRAGQQIADDRRQAEPLRDVAEHQRRREAAGQRQDQVVGVHREASRARERRGRSVKWRDGQYTVGVACSALRHLVSARSVGAGHRQLEQPQVDRELAAMMRHMTEREVAEHDFARLAPPRASANQQPPGLISAASLTAANAARPASAARSSPSSSASCDVAANGR